MKKPFLPQMYLLGGSPCSGKSSVAAELANQYPLCIYKVDDHQENHLTRSRPDSHPVMSWYAKMDWQAIFSQPVIKQVEDVLAFNRERFPMILEDVRKLEADLPLVVEGAALLPELANQISIRPRNAVYLIPTKEFQIANYAQRTWIKAILKECRQSDLAFENWMERDYLYGQEIERQAKFYGYPTITVDGRIPIIKQSEYVANSFGLSWSDF
jgi:adenylate kinase family enzyme